MSYYDHLPSVDRPSTLLKDFTLKPLGQMSSNYHVESSIELKICKNGQNGHGSLIKMTAMPIYGRNT